MTKSYFWTFLCERLCPLAQCDKWERQRKLSRQKKSRADLFVQKWKFSPHQFGLAWCFKCPFVHRGSISDYNESWLNKNRHMKITDSTNLNIKFHIEVVYWNDLRSHEATGTFEYNIGNDLSGSYFHIKRIHEVWMTSNQNPPPHQKNDFHNFLLVGKVSDPVHKARPRVRKTLSVRQQCWPESFCKIRKVFATSSLLTEEFLDTLQYKISR